MCCLSSDICIVLLEENIKLIDQSGLLPSLRAYTLHYTEDWIDELSMKHFLKSNWIIRSILQLSCYKNYLFQFLFKMTRVQTLFLFYSIPITGWPKKVCFLFPFFETVCNYYYRFRRSLFLNEKKVFALFLRHFFCLKDTSWQRYWKAVALLNSFFS